MIGGAVVTSALLVVFGGSAFATRVALAAIERDAGVSGGRTAALPTGLPADLPEEVRPCADCHLNPGLRLSYRDGSGRLHQGFIDPHAYESSVHFRAGERACGDCHKGDYSRVPHPAGNPAPSCSDCHADRRREFQDIYAAAHRSVHYAAGVGVEFDCGTCHSPHTMHAGREMTVAEKNAACIDCHENRFNPTGLTLAQRHAWHPQAALHLNRIACIDCHTQPTGADNSFRHDILPRAQATSDCYACHGANTKMAAYVGNFEGERPRPYTRGQLVREYYISGGTRSGLLDRSGLLLMLLVAVGTATHGLARYVRKRRRTS
jgi:predicted CXXCH cytochrome family protein